MDEFGDVISSKFIAVGYIFKGNGEWEWLFANQSGILHSALPLSTGCCAEHV
ncbi:hypothetical protein KIN20_035072 [Parelaphostrongylus tenuis]|uniref:Uncharacterized protein n=1 Tax=Parelaphostrongylus tenuis TaxID=148309 RepID=A0AAD5WKI4_PARTN|nr:hypothetical protein KIN20_035072 [Parelaphostrongylus tenuis]